jgi:hypothetical protein
VHFSLRTCSSLAVALAGNSFAAATPVEQVTVLAKYQAHALQVTEGSALAVPRHYAGFYGEWTNEPDFSQRRRLVEGATYRVKARLTRTEVRQFPEGWGARSGKPYSIYHLQAESATRVEDRK